MVNVKLRKYITISEDGVTALPESGIRKYGTNSTVLPSQSCPVLSFRGLAMCMCIPQSSPHTGQRVRRGTLSCYWHNCAKLVKW
jgi:hypothetical protein